MNICVVIPAYNEIANISWLVSSLKKKGYAVLVVDDGSTDDTASAAETAGAVVLRNDVNMGKGASLIRGFSYVKQKGFDGVIVMDGDGQHLPEDIPVLLRSAGAGGSLVVGNRMAKPGAMPFSRWLTNKIMSLLLSCLTRQSIPDSQCGFRFIAAPLLEKLKLSCSNYEIESEMLMDAGRSGYKIFSVPVKSVYRGTKSQINPVIDTLRFFRFIRRQLRRRSVDDAKRKG
ncbi:MAG: glycosyltransferase family 2 protein [Candidatus Omnitrophota bacterium]